MSTNNPYERENSFAEGVFKAGAVAGAGALSWNAYKHPIKTYSTFTKVSNKVFPVKNPILNSAQSRYAEAQEIIATAMGERDKRDMILSMDKKEHAAKVFGKSIDWGIVDPLYTNSMEKAASKYTFTDVDQILDIDGNSIGKKIQDVLGQKFNTSATLDRFEGTTGIFKIDGKELKIDFAKRVGNSESWLSRRGEAFYSAPWRAHMTKRGDKLGYDMMDPNSAVLHALLDDLNDGGTLMWHNNNDSIRSMYEKFRGDVENPIPHSQVISKIKDEIRRNKTGIRLKGTDTISELQEALNSYNRFDTFVIENNDMLQSLYGSEAVVDKWSRYMVGHDKRFVGVGADRISARAVNVDTSKGSALRKAYNIFTDLRKDKSLVKVVNYNRSSAKSKSARDVEDLVGMFGGYTLGQERTAEFGFAFRTSTFPQYAEGFKYMKGYSFMDKHIYYDKEAELSYLGESMEHIKFGGITQHGGKIDEAAIKELRFNPFIDDKTMNKRFGWTKFVQEKEALGKNKGIYNMSLVINPFTTETIQVSSKYNKHMKTLGHKQFTVGTVNINPNSEAFEASKIDFKWLDHTDISGGDGKPIVRTKKVSIKDVMEDKTMSRQVLNGDAWLQVNKGTVLGAKKAGMEITPDLTLEEVLNKDSEVLTSKFNMLIESEDYRQMLVATKRMRKTEKYSDSVKWIGRVIDNPSKLALWGAIPRSAYSSGDSKIMNDVLSQAGLYGAEGTISLDFYKKTLSQSVKGKGVVFGKNSVESLHFMQSALGWQALQDTNIVLGGDAAVDFARYINDGEKYIDASGNLSLTSLMKRGKLTFKQLTDDTKAFGQQYTDTVQVLGRARRSWVRGRKSSLTTKFSSDQAKEMADVLTGHIEKIEKFGKFVSGAEGSKESVALAKQMVKGNIDVKEAMRAAGVSAKEVTMGIFAGVMPQEQNWQALGEGFNEMRISFKSLPSFLNKPEVLRDLSVQSLNNTSKIAQELLLLEESAAGKDVSKYAAAYASQFGDIAELSGKEEILEMLGGNLSYDRSSLKNPEFLMKSFLNNEQNKNGFFVNMADRKVYIPSRDMWNSYITADKTPTFDGFFAETHELLTGAAEGVNMSPKSFEQWQRSLLDEIHSTKAGLMQKTTMRVDHSLYSKHIADFDFIHNESIRNVLKDYMQNGLNGSDEVKVAAKEMENMLGNMAQISKKDFEFSMTQLLSDTKKQASKSGKEMGEVLVAQFGEDHFLSKYTSKMRANMEKADINKLVGEITGDQIEVGKKIKAAYSRFIESGDVGELHNLKELSGDVLHTLNVRHPDIYTGSWSQTMTLIGGQNENKRISLGSIVAANANADLDGDSISSKPIMSKAARDRTHMLIDRDQREAYKYMKMDTKKSMEGILFGKSKPEWDIRAAIEHADDFAEAILRDTPGSTAVSSYFTKGLTGSFNIQAMGIKGYIKELEDIKNLREQDINVLEGFFGQVTSKITEQEVISSKQAEIWIKDIAGKATRQGRIESLINIIGTDDGINAVKESVREIGGLHPLVMMSAMTEKSLNPASQKASAAYDAVSDMLDVQNGWREIEADRYKSMYNYFDLNQTSGVSADDAYKQYSDWLSVNRSGLMSQQEAYEKAGLEGKSLLDVMSTALSEDGKRNGSMVSDNIDSILSRATKALGRNPEANLMDEAFDTVRNLQYAKASYKMLTPRPFNPSMPQAGRSVIGLESLQKGISWMLESKTRTAGVIGLGLTALTAFNVLTSDGSVEDPNDLPSVNNPSFDIGRTSMLSSESLSPNVNVNANISLLTDSNTSTDSILNKMGFRTHNTISVRNDGEDPYKQDLMYYR